MEIKGSEKQIKWAEDILRTATEDTKELAEELKKDEEHMSFRDPEKEIRRLQAAEDAVENFIYEFYDGKSASEIIDHRGFLQERFPEKFISCVRLKKDGGTWILKFVGKAMSEEY